MASEAEGDGHSTLAVMLLDLVRDFVVMAGRSIAGAGDVFRKDCSDLIRRIALLIHLAEEIRNFRGDSYEQSKESSSSSYCRSYSSSSTDSINASTSSDGLSELVAAIQASKRLLYNALTFRRNDRSPVTDGAAKKLIFQFQYVTTRLDNALANLPYDHFCISDEVEEQVDLVRAQLRRAAAKYGSLTSISELPANKLDVNNLGSVGDEFAERPHYFRNRNEQIVRSNSEKLRDSDSTSDDCSDDVHSEREGELASKSQDEFSKCDEIVIPENFLCPISLELMTDPVVVSSGQTYERSNIQRWIDRGNTICPKTQQQLHDLTLIPNFLLRRVIKKWCLEHNVKLETGFTDGKLEKFDGSYHNVCQGTVAVETLVRKLSRGLIAEQRDAVAEIRELSKNSKDYRAQIAEAGAIPHLVNLLTSDDIQIQENAVSSILNLSLYDENKKLVMLSGAVPYISQLLKTGSMEGRESAAATIYSLSLVDENKIIIGASGVISDLLKILEIGSSRGKKDAARALLNLCFYQGNKARAVRAGIITPLSKMLSDSNDPMVDEALYIISALCGHPEVNAAMMKTSSMLALTDILKTGSPHSKENAAAILLALCNGDSEKLAWLSQLGAVMPLMELAKNGTERARRKAASLLEQLRKSW